jgi:hypothetical protein
MIAIAAAPAHADDTAALPPLETQEHHPAIDQVIYRGVVGNILEAVPLPPEQRVQLQRGNAILGSAFTGRSLAVLLGLASPVLMIGGLIWGIWSAANIKAIPSAHAAGALPNAAPEPAQAVPPMEAAQLAPAESDSMTDPARLARTE